MLARLGHVLYWAAAAGAFYLLLSSGVAASRILGLELLLNFSSDAFLQKLAWEARFRWLALMIWDSPPAVLLWFTGLALRYVLAGRRTQHHPS